MFETHWKVFNIKASAIDLECFFLDLDNPLQPWVINDILQADNAAILREIKMPLLPNPTKANTANRIWGI